MASKKADVPGAAPSRSSTKKENKKKERSISGRTLKVVGIIVLSLVIIFAVILVLLPKNEHFFDGKTNKISYPSERAVPRYTITKLSDSGNYTASRVAFQGRPFLGQPATIYGLLFLPKGKDEVPGIVMLPGGGVKKENEPAAKAFADMGYAVLVVDQRGIGETGGYYPNYEQDRALFQGGQEPVQFLGVNDALRALDVLRSLKQVDEHNTFIAGASMGGRYAMIAAALDGKVKGAIIISSAGFHVEGSADPQLRTDQYFLAIDPDRYVKGITPKKIVFLHSTNDTIVPFTDAQTTYFLAAAPKSLYVVDGCPHGYCDRMYPFLQKELKDMVW